MPSWASLLMGYCCTPIDVTPVFSFTMMWGTMLPLPYLPTLPRLEDNLSNKVILELFSMWLEAHIIYILLILKLKNKKTKKQTNKKLDPVSTGWPFCLKVIDALAVLLREADKLTLGQGMIVVDPCLRKHQ
jgi:hypothetical protein